MKKTYINPELNVVRIATQHMIATSGPLVDGATDDVNDLLSREFELEEEEDDDDFEMEDEDI